MFLPFGFLFGRSVSAWYSSLKLVAQNQKKHIRSGVHHTKEGKPPSSIRIQGVFRHGFWREYTTYINEVYALQAYIEGMSSHPYLQCPDKILDEVTAKSANLQADSDGFPRPTNSGGRERTRRSRGHALMSSHSTRAKIMSLDRRSLHPSHQVWMPFSLGSHRSQSLRSGNIFLVKGVPGLTSWVNWPTQFKVVAYHQIGPNPKV